jgi:hypothetical protein
MPEGGRRGNGLAHYPPADSSTIRRTYGPKSITRSIQ